MAPNERQQPFPQTDDGDEMSNETQERIGRRILDSMNRGGAQVRHVTEQHIYTYNHRHAHGWQAIAAGILTFIAVAALMLAINYVVRIENVPVAAVFVGIAFACGALIWALTA